MSKKIERIFVIYTDKDGTLTNTDNMFGKVSKSNKTLGDIQFHNKFKNNLFFDAALYGMLYVYNRTISYRKGASEVTNEWKDNYEVCIATRSPGTDSNTIFGELIRKDLKKTLEKKKYIMINLYLRMVIKKKKQMRIYQLL